MDISLPVMRDAYERITRPVEEDPYKAYLEARLDHLRQRIANAQLATMPSTNPASSTLPSPDLVVANTIGDDVASALYRRIFELKLSVSHPDNETGALWIARHNAKAVFGIIVGIGSRAVTGNVQSSTRVFVSHATYGRVGSTTSKQPIENRHLWVRMVYECVRLGQTSKALRLMYASVENHFKKQELVALSGILAEIDLSRLNPQTMTALLRISSRAKQALPSWQNLLQRVHAELTRLNVPDSAGVMVGLIG